jgi:hypothetical protein
MGYRTPNIDRLANEGMRFTDSYGERSCLRAKLGLCRPEHGLRRPLTSDHRLDNSPARSSRRVYQLTRAGHRALAKRHGEWRDFARAVHAVVERPA